MAAALVMQVLDVGRSPTDWINSMPAKRLRAALLSTDDSIRLIVVEAPHFTSTLTCHLCHLPLQDFAEVAAAHEAFVRTLIAQTLLLHAAMVLHMYQLFALSRRLCALVKATKDRRQGVDLEAVMVRFFGPGFNHQGLRECTAAMSGWLLLGFGQLWHEFGPLGMGISRTRRMSQALAAHHTTTCQ
jgi:hypothetical protein